MRMYDYLVSYHFDAKGCVTPCHGTVQISRKKKIKTFEDINEINKLIEESIDDATNLSIYNFVLLGRNKH